MLDTEPTGEDRTGTAPAEETAPTSTPTRRTRTTRRRAAEAEAAPAPAEDTPAEVAAPARRTRKKAAVPPENGESAAEAPAPRTRRKKAAPVAAEPAAAEEPSAEPVPSRRRARAALEESPAEPAPSRRRARAALEESPAEPAPSRRRAPAAATVLFVAPEVPEVPAAAAAAPAAPAAAVAGEEPEARTSRRRRATKRAAEPAAEPEPVEPEPVEPEPVAAEDDEEEDANGKRRRRRGRRGRGRGRGAGDEGGEAEEETAGAAEDAGTAEETEETEAAEALTRRRRRRRRSGAAGEAEAAEEGVVTVVKVRQPRAARDEVQGVAGSTRLEAKRQRRRDGRDQRRTRPPILSESEFLARREAVDRTMVVRQKGDRTQVAVLEDKVLVEHYVTRASAASMVGNVYLGKVQNVLPSMEAAFVDIGRGRNAVLYAGEVNWDVSGLEGRARSIEQALKSGDSVLVQVTKDPVGHKGARLTSHVALSGRHLVYVPHGNASGISRKLPDTERKRLRDVLKSLVPDGAGVIVRTAAEGAAEEELARDVQRLQAQWEDIQAKAAEGGAPVLLYEEPDLVIRVVRDLFNEDFRELVVQGSEAYDQVEMYLKHVSPDLVERLHRYTGPGDLFAERRVDEQILKGLDRKVFLPSGGSLIIDRTEAMTVIDVNTGKYTGTGGNLEETVTRNNLEAAEEIVRQLRLRDLGGIIVIDFIDMVLESNRELVLRRLTECLGRDRTKHQVTEITSLGLVQMTRKRIGQGLLEAFSETCEVCKGRGLIIHTEPVPDRRPAAKAVAAVAAAPVEGPGRRRRRSTAVVLDEDLEPVTEADEEPPGDGVDTFEVVTDDPDETGDDEQVLAEGRRRGRRGGRRRTR